MNYCQYAQKTLDRVQLSFLQGVKANCERLAEMIGLDAYEAFCDAFPDNITWSQINEKVKARIAELELPDDCSCKLPEESCPACRAAAVLLDGVELPY